MKIKTQLLMESGSIKTLAERMAVTMEYILINPKYKIVSTNIVELSMKAVGVIFYSEAE